MSPLTSTSLKVSNYKCFGKGEGGYAKLLPISLVVGRNNTGKSTLLDLLAYACAPKDLNSFQHKGEVPKVVLETILAAEDLGKAFSSSTSGGDIGGNHGTYGQQFVGLKMRSVIGTNGVAFESLVDRPNLRGVNYWQQLAGNIVKNPFSAFRFRRILADRDLLPEGNSETINIQSNGAGATNAIQRFINSSQLPRELVEHTLLKDLNHIFRPDGNFSDLTTQLHPTGSWEIFLQETEKGLIPLSHSGSGVKTILLVLVFLHLLPFVEKTPLKSYIFGFEELENNLHPALQRRLLLFLRSKAEIEGCHFVLTTHSNVCIDLFAHDSQAQILHVTHDSRAASAKCVVTYVDNKGILDDLDLRASDLLQANGLVWLEGPSDWLYFNRWIELWTDGELREGAHYQCVYYGGRLLAHLSAADPDVDADEVVNMLRVNRNALLIIDSDKREENSKINATKTRLINEVTAIGGMSWVTAGKEIENYLPIEALQNKYPETKLKLLAKHADFATYLDKSKKGEGKKYLRKKVLFAEQILPLLTKQMLQGTFDLSQRLDEAVTAIRMWNRL